LLWRKIADKLLAFRDGLRTLIGVLKEKKRCYKHQTSTDVADEAPHYDLSVLISTDRAYFFDKRKEDTVI